MENTITIATDFPSAPPKDGPNPFRLCPSPCDEQLNARLSVQSLLSSCLAIILPLLERLSIENRYQKFLACSIPLLEELHRVAEARATDDPSLQIAGEAGRRAADEGNVT